MIMLWEDNFYYPLFSRIILTQRLIIFNGYSYKELLEAVILLH